MSTRYPDASDEIRSVRVREVAESIQYGHTASAISRRDGPRFLRITDIQNGGVDWDSVPSCNIGAEEVPKYKLSAGDLVFARTGATTGKSFLIRDCPDAVFASYLIRVRASKEVDPRYLALFFQSPDYWQQIERGKRGIGQPNVNGKILGEIELPLPGLREQKEIVAEVEKQFTRLEAGVAALRRVQANLKRYRISVLKAACEGRLLRSNPKSWRNISLGEVVVSMKNGIYKPRDAYADDGVACLRMYNIETGKIVWKDIKRMRLSREEIKDYGLLEGDLLVNRVNSRELVGKAAAIPTGLEECVFESKNIRVRLKTDQAEPRFVNFVLSANGATYFNRNAQQVVGMASISQPQVAGFPLSLPPLGEQTRIVAEVDRRFSVVDELEAAVSASLQRATRLRQAVLQRAFAGEL
jgi:type I restriction enzyme, S subunit